MTRTVEQTVVDDHGIMINWALRRLQVPKGKREDGYQGGVLGLVKAESRYEADKGLFRAYAAGFVLEGVRIAVDWDRRPHVQIVSLDGRRASLATSSRRRTQDRPAHWNDPVFDEAAMDDLAAAVATFVATLDEDDRYLYCRLYRDGVTQTAVAAELGLSKMAVSRKVARFRKRATVALAAYVPAA